MLKYISSPDESSNGESLPWSNEYLDKFPSNKGELYPIAKFIRTKKGFIIESNMFKAFVFKDSKMAKYLEDAIIHWKTGANECYAMFVTLEDKPNIAFDDEVARVTVSVLDNEIVINWGKPLKHSTGENLNPFLLPGTPSPTAQRARKQA